MSKPDSSLQKSVVHQQFILLVEDKIRDLQSQLKALSDGAANDSKSSSGDKHETGRAMMHLEQENLTKQLGELQKQLSSLSLLPQDENHYVIGLGSLVRTEDAVFYLSAAIGKLNMAGQIVYALSAQSPFGHLLLGKKLGDSVEMNGKEHRIQAIH